MIRVLDLDAHGGVAVVRIEILSDPVRVHQFSAEPTAQMIKIGRVPRRALAQLPEAVEGDW